MAAILLDREGVPAAMTSAAAAVLGEGPWRSPWRPAPRMKFPNWGEFVVEVWPGTAGDLELVTLTPVAWAAEKRLRQVGALFGLTEGEIATLAALLRYGSRHAAIQRARLNRNTVKSQLTSICAKAGRKRTSEVMVLFARLTALPGGAADPSGQEP